MREEDRADFTVFQCHRVEMITVCADRIHPQQLAGHLKSGDLLVATGADLISLEMPETYRVQIREGVIHPVQQSVFGYLATAPDDLIELADVGLAQSHRQTKLMRAAGGAACFQGMHIDCRGC